MRTNQRRLHFFWFILIFIRLMLPFTLLEAYFWAFYAFFLSGLQCSMSQTQTRLLLLYMPTHQPPPYHKRLFNRIEIERDRLRDELREKERNTVKGDWCVASVIFSVGKATLQSQMSVCLSVCHRNLSASQNWAYWPSSLSTIEQLYLSAIWPAFATSKPFRLVVLPGSCDALGSAGPTYRVFKKEGKENICL